MYIYTYINEANLSFVEDINKYLIKIESQTHYTNTIEKVSSLFYRIRQEIRNQKSSMFMWLEHSDPIPLSIATVTASLAHGPWNCGRI